MADQKSEKTPKDLDSTSQGCPIIPKSLAKNKREIWRDSLGYPGYQVSNFGQVRSIRIRVLKPCRTKITLSDDPGYPIVSIGNRKVLVHRMVAEAFMGIKIPETHVIHHLDNDKGNPRLDNLEMVTRSQNTKYAYMDKRIGCRDKLNRFQKMKMMELYASGEYLTRDLAEMFNVSKSIVCGFIKKSGMPLMFYSKVTPKIRKEITNKYVPFKVSMKMLAQEYGISEGTVESILRNKPSGRRKENPNGRKRVSRNMERFDALFGTEVRQDPEGSGLYLPRVPNHPQELEGLVQIGQI